MIEIIEFWRTKQGIRYLFRDGEAYITILVRFDDMLKLYAKEGDNR